MNFTYENFGRYMQMYHAFATILPSHLDRFVTSVSPQQMSSKAWLVRNLDETYASKNVNQWPPRVRVLVLGSWFGWPLIDMLMTMKNVEIEHITLVDKDRLAVDVACRYRDTFYDMDGHDINVIHGDCWEVGLPEADIVINTSCEHMQGTILCRSWPNNPLFVLQSTDKPDPQHVNLVKSATELAEQNGITKASLFASLALGRSNRFMVIGTTS